MCELIGKYHSVIQAFCLDWTFQFSHHSVNPLNKYQTRETIFIEV